MSINSPRYQGWHIQPNSQNAHMLDSYVNASKTLHQLVKMGITVTELRLGSVHPVITVQPTAETKKLKGVMVRSINRSGTRSAIYSAMMNQCRIEWENRYVH